ncbi:diguanylate cyclase (GGDEF) domain-containing protein [Paenibacillus sp. UNC496MF]|nr:diguanylate cyclase (GGDEF) domain-containing protein [Paenibacillus sp. UNC496MF]
MLRMNDSTKMSEPAPGGLRAEEPKEAQQPDAWTPSGAYNLGGEPLCEDLLAQAWESWLAEALAVDSPLARHTLRLSNEHGDVVARRQSGTGSAGPRALEEPLFGRAGGPLNGPSLALEPSGEVDEAFYRPLLQIAAMLLREKWERAAESAAVQRAIKRHRLNEREARRRDNLFQAAIRLNNLNDVYSVLRALLDDVGLLYPSANAHLFLTQDYVDGDSRIQPLLLRHTSDDLNADAFLSGRPVTGTDADGTIRLAIPMRGKQAVYGVLSLALPGEDWDAPELQSVAMLTETAGFAFENAKLFEQSNLLVSELQLINELTKRLNQSLRLNEIFEFAMTELLQIFKADYCNLLQLSADNHFQIVASNVPAAANELYSAGYGFCGIVYSTKEPLIISDYTATRVVDSRLMDATGSRSLIAAPVMAGTEVVGVILVSHRVPNYFSYENYKLLQVLSTHIGLAISNASLHAEVRRMVITDNLTGLHARHYLNEQIQLRQRKDRCGSLVLVDIDHFKRVNDTFGHLTGDSILVIVSDVIRASIRDSDIAARWGGEELAVYLPDIQSGQAYRIAERIRSAVEAHTNPAVTVSCGLSEWIFEEEKISVESLFNRADMALYEAKKNGRNRICVG